jgi:hypothetical protein
LSRNEVFFKPWNFKGELAFEGVENHPPAALYKRIYQMGRQERSETDCVRSELSPGP